MNTVYSDVVFTNSQPDQQTAIKLNLLRDDLSAAIGSIGGYYTDTWRWTTKTTDAAVSGNVGINAASWSAATFLNISETSAAGIDKTVQMDKVAAAGNTILVKDGANANNYAEYTFTGPGVDMGTWRQYPVSTVKSGGVLPNNNASTTLTIYVQGATGGGGAGTGDMTKAIYDADNNGKVDTCDSLPWGSITGKPTVIGDMLKSVYDTNGDGISDHAAQADSVPWTGVTGRPSVFPPDSTAMLKSVYDTNGDGVSDHAALADAAPWIGITGKPSTFPPDSTAMLKSVYDTNADGISDHAALADAVPWTGISGKPATFPPDSTAMLKSVYDTNANNKVDAAESADSVAWTGITGKPASFPPSSHGTTHLDNGTDAIPVVTLTRTGLAPTLSGNAATYLNGNGAFTTPTGVTPAAHAVTHKSGGSDVIALDTLGSTTDITTLNSSTTAHGLCPKLSGTTTTFLRGDGTWVAPAGGGDMTKAVYDTNADNIVDHAALADTAPWTGITGRPGFINKTAAYTVVSGDIGKYFICSGGSWTLTLPAPVAGFFVRVRNDQGISGTTGTITLSPTGGTIDGLATQLLCAGQECTVISDGTNWRTFGRAREVVIGTQDVSNVASASFLLPPDYRAFRLEFTDLVAATNDSALQGQISVNGGSTWITSALYAQQLNLNNSATVLATTNNYAQTFWWLGNNQWNAGVTNGVSDILFYPGDASNTASYVGTFTGYHATFFQLATALGSYASLIGRVNAIKYNMNVGNIATSQLTVTGLV